MGHVPAQPGTSPAQSGVSRRRSPWSKKPYYLTTHIRRYRTGYGWRGKVAYERVLARHHHGPIDAITLHFLLNNHARSSGLGEDEKTKIDRAIHLLDHRRGGIGSLERVRKFAKLIGMRIVVK